MKIFKMKSGLYMIAVTMIAAGAALADATWTDDFEAAKATAKAQNRFMLLDFTGSDWCGWCIKLDKEVFSKSEFKKYAAEKLVCVELDYPMKSKPSKKVQKQNEELKNQFAIRGYPTIILLDPNGEKIGQTGYKAGGPEAYVEHLEEIISPHASKFGKPSGDGGSVAAGGPQAKAPAASVDTMRTWTSQSGSTIEARYYRSVANMVELRKQDGATLRIDLSSLSDADHDYLRSIKAIK